jgi:all-trans-retinol dehydrogenase (NAD+)
MRTFNVNTLAHLHTVREFMPDMKANKRGHIVTIASVAGLMGCPGMMDYCASKFASIGMEQCLRYELIKSGDSDFIKTTCIAPYLIKTGMFLGGKQPWPFTPLEPAFVADRTVWAT